MRLQSMTGFARSEGLSGRYRWAWELRSVNGKGLDLRIRVPQGREALETVVKQRVSAMLTRGNVQISLTQVIAEPRMQAVVNENTLAAVLSLRDKLSDILAPEPLRLDSLLSIRGLVDFKEPEEAEEDLTSHEQDILNGLDAALVALTDMRAREGNALGQTLKAQLIALSGLLNAIEKDPSRSSSSIADRLSQQITLLLGSESALDRDRLYGEAALLAARADVREELDRLAVHVDAARELLMKGGPVGRKLDFMAQEFNREANTICSKSNSADVTAAGIELKVIIDQFREQVQNLE
ncbi:YicC family protein [Rhizobium sp. CFBP 8762]|uniref:YicC/YloC family endoribonuclease n=1 Tax=Rhizobium sp. CFBP 8762 TaxID=2775279 RepID=UPI001782EDD1|nr:YicC/YloC family endoribonuclease [Rhizobium sp. CFBP 8762]MBD8553062.1 YicC family protein [Rhizobium sp. CFBP 8762]